ncbi:metal ABC transporter substrate-binding protein [Streptomyces sp. NY05-11A]|uniref:metal ABC transporter substrate-binding protein n=1 Tax=Streptomyces soliscabiei TaxID=588897 RepID=UPI0029B78143|nr:metal ABC transporter substrate-binding protein [Streptomyces sp. NY05-11A]MDX2679227.1 metal ABC transporter substrate-binding protein [Streptomyces sp. NY05-11A]
MAALTSCSTESKAADSGKLEVVTTVAPLTSIISAVGGDRIDLVGLVPEGTNSHTFEPPPDASKSLSKADVIFISGLELEDPTKELAESTKSPETPIIELGTQALPESDYIYDFSFPKKDGKPNPHLWTDPTYAITYAHLVRDELIKHDPDNAAVYQSNDKKFTEQATALSDALRKDQESIPQADRKLLTYHDAYAYFAKTYDWKVVGAIQPKNFEDPPPKDITRLIDQVKKENVKAVFGSEVFPSKVLEQIGKSTGARYVDVLRDDDLPGDPGDPEHSWLGLMRFDYVTMIEALGGEAPALKALDVSQKGATDATYAK